LSGCDFIERSGHPAERLADPLGNQQRRGEGDRDHQARDAEHRPKAHGETRDPGVEQTIQLGKAGQRKGVTRGKRASIQLRKARKIYLWRFVSSRNADATVFISAANPSAMPLNDFAKASRLRRT